MCCFFRAKGATIYAINVHTNCRRRQNMLIVDIETNCRQTLRIAVCLFICLFVYVPSNRIILGLFLMVITLRTILFWLQILHIIKTTPHIIRKVLYIIFNLHIRQSRRSICIIVKLQIFVRRTHKKPDTHRKHVHACS